MDRSPRPALVPLALTLTVVLGLAGVTASRGQVPTTGTAPAAKRTIVGDIIIHGNRQVPAEHIKNQMKTRVGKEFVPEVLQEDIRALYSTRQFANIKADVPYDGPDRVVVKLLVREYPGVVQKVTYEGAYHLSKDDLEQLSGVRKGMPCNPIANKVACRRIVQRYNEDGRPFASCTLRKGGEEGDTEVIFNVTEGPKARIRDISFSGNRFAWSDLLKNRINSSAMILGLFGGTYNAAMVDNDQTELIKYYRSHGFHDVRVARELRYSRDGRELSIVFHINEGVQYQLAETPHVHGVKSVPAEALEALNKMKGGETYNQGKIEADKARIRDWLGMTGREVRVQEVPVFSKEKPGIVQVNYEVEERPPARVGQIFVVGNERTRMPVILRQVPLYPGQVLTYPDVRQAEKNLTRLNIFEAAPDGSVRPTVSVLDNPHNPDSPYKDILIQVQEASTGSLMFGLGVNSDSGLTGSIVLNERNFDLFRPPTSLEDILNGTAWRGAGQEFRLEAVPGTQLQRYVASFREPFLFDSPWGLTVSGYYYQRYFNEYTEDRLGGRLTIGRKLNDFWSVAGTVRLENVDVYNVPAWAPPDYLDVRGNNFVAGFRAGVTRDSRDSILRPTEGSLLDVAFEEVIGDQVFSLATLDFSQYWTAYQRPDGSGRHVLAFHHQTGWASSNTPVFERYFGGGFRSIRGFQFRGVGPDVNGFKVGGDFLLMNSLEYQIPVRANDQVYVVGFVDSGAVSPRIDQIDNYRVSAGFGLRLIVPMFGPVPIALDFGFPILKGPFDNTQVFNFFMGFTR